MPLCTMSLHLTLDIQIQLDKFLLIKYQNGKRKHGDCFFLRWGSFKSHLILLFICRAMSANHMARTHPWYAASLWPLLPCVWCDAYSSSFRLLVVGASCIPPGCTMFMRLYLSTMRKTHTPPPCWTCVVDASFVAARLQRCIMSDIHTTPPLNNSIMAQYSNKTASFSLCWLRTIVLIQTPSFLRTILFNIVSSLHHESNTTTVFLLGKIGTSFEAAFSVS